MLTSYRIHLSPSSRRNSVRTNTPRKSASASSSSRSPESVTPQYPGTPPVDQGRVYDSTPPLTQATLPSANTLLNSSISGRISPSSRPSTSYSPNPHHTLPALSAPGLSLPVSTPSNYNYRTGTPSYHDQSLANPYPTYANTATGASQNCSHNAVGSSNFTYSHSHSNYGGHSQQNSRPASPSATMHSRHSLSHISHSRYPSSHRPPSPILVSSHTSAHSGPPTPTYPVSYADTHTYSQPHSAMVTSQPAVHNTQMQSQSYLFQSGYSPNTVIAHSPRYLPPLTLAPIQDERYTRRLETPRAYLHHSQPHAGYSQYHHSMGIGHSSWKAESMRKGVGATVI